MNPTAEIALSLGVFFLAVAVFNRFKTRRDLRRAEDARSAAKNGGTPDSPVHLESPFAARGASAAPADPAAPPNPAAAAAAAFPAAPAAPAPQAAVPPAPPPEPEYVWE